MFKFNQHKLIDFKVDFFQHDKHIYYKCINCMIILHRSKFDDLLYISPMHHPELFHITREVLTCNEYIIKNIIE